MGQTRLAYRLIVEELKRTDLSQHDRMLLIKYLVQLERRRPKTSAHAGIPQRKRGRPRKLVDATSEETPTVEEKQSLAKFLETLE